jgi:tetratricopeptide (TPR) repeat protein
MPKSRAEIQKEINNYKAAIASRDDPASDSRFDPGVQQIQNKEKSELIDLEKELAEAKARGEKGRSQGEIRGEIAETEAKADEWRTIEYRATNPMQKVMSHNSACYMQCTVDALQQELNEAVEESAESEKTEIESIKQTFEQEIRSNPNDAGAYIRRGYLFAARSMTDGKAFFDQAVADFTEAIKIDPKATEAYLGRAGLYSQKNDYDPAIEDYSQALRLDPKNEEAYTYRGGLYSQKGKYDEALADFNEALRLNPQCKNVHAFRGLMYFTQGVYSKENADYDKAVENVDKAVLDIEEAVRLDPGNEAAADLLQKVKNEKTVVDRMRRERQERYDRLVQEKNRASTENEFENLNKAFLEMGGYENARSLADECNTQCRILKGRREEQERTERQRQNEENARRSWEAAKKAKKKRVIAIVVVIALISILAGFIMYNSQENSITIPDTVAIIREGEFARKQLVSVTIPNSVTLIENKAFRRNKLASVEIPAGVTSIGEDAFAGNRLTSIAIGANVAIGNDAFGSDFENFYANNGMAAGTYTRTDTKSADWNVWYDNFRYRYNNGSISILGYNGAGGDVAIPNEISGYPVKVIGKRAFNEKKITKVIIPDNVTTIEEMAFFGAWNSAKSVPLGTISDVTFGKNVAAIGDRAFENNSLSSVTLPNSVTSIGFSAFSDNPVTSIRLGANVKLGSNGDHGALGKGTGFNTAYANNDKMAGTYTRPNAGSGTWTRR